MNIQVTDNYHRLRVEELELTADYLAKLAEQKDRDATSGNGTERSRPPRIRAGTRTAPQGTGALPDRPGRAARTGRRRWRGQAEAKLTEIEDAIDGLTRRAANIRAGHVYVISNIGAFGEDMVKIGMTRRLDPMDRVRELGDASVPFRYDVHAMVFSDDAVGLETQLHHQLAGRRAQPGQPAPRVLPRPPRRSPRHPHPPGRLHRRMDRRTRSPRMAQSQQARRQQDTPESAR